MKKNGKWYFIANLITYAILYGISIYITLNFVDLWIVKLIIFIVMLFVCDYIEEKILSRFVNIIIERFLNE